MMMMIDDDVPQRNETLKWISMSINVQNTILMMIDE